MAENSIDSTVKSEVCVNSINSLDSAIKSKPPLYSILHV